MKTKHLTARKAVLHEAIVENQECDLVYKNTKVMVADPFTKALEGASFQLLMNVIMGWLSIKRLEAIVGPKSTGVRCNNGGS